MSGKARIDYEALLGQVREIEWAKLAAFIDGEGCIYINCQKSKQLAVSPRHFLSVVITNTGTPLMVWLKSTFGGSVFAVRSSSKLSKKPLYRWQVNEVLAECILQRCLPYFTLKRAQAEVGLAFRALKKAGRARRSMVETLVERQAFAATMSALNRGSNELVN